MKPDYILFTDGSSITEPGKIMQYAACAFFVINNDNHTATSAVKQIGSGDSAAAELHAIYSGLRYVQGLIGETDDPKTVLVLTDSNYSIVLIEKHLNKWYNGHAVKKKLRKRFSNNSELFEGLFEIMSDERMKVLFVHVKSHLRVDDIEGLQKRILDAGFIVSDEVAENIIKYNRVVDRMAKSESRDLARECGFFDHAISLISRPKLLMSKASGAHDIGGVS